MQAIRLEPLPARVPLGDDREIVLVRYVPSGRGGNAGVPEIEGFIRTVHRRSQAPSRVQRYARPQMSELSHVDGAGKARMVNVGGKEATERVAVAAGQISMKPSTLAAIRQNQVAKGDVLGVARIAGIQAAKRTADLIPLCHQVPLSEIAVEFTADETLPGFRVKTTARTTAQTGVEMEAIIAASVSLVTLYDMAKGVDKGMVIGDISLIEKRGGKSGDWVRTA
jgi:cyclic pyranopterin phosphate synthase